HDNANASSGTTMIELVLSLVLPIMVKSIQEDKKLTCDSVTKGLFSDHLVLGDYTLETNCRHGALSEDRVFFQSRISGRLVHACSAVVDFGLSSRKDSGGQVSICRTRLSRTLARNRGKLFDCKWVYAAGTYSLTVMLKAEMLKNGMRLFLWFGNAAFVMGPEVTFNEEIFDSNYYNCRGGIVNFKNYDDDSNILDFVKNQASNIQEFQGWVIISLVTFLTLPT
ncbi:hypothetical protein Bpfe_023039, partial [Biomphalaria pfeifferi]